MSGTVGGGSLDYNAPGRGPLRKPTISIPVLGSRNGGLKYPCQFSDSEIEVAPDFSIVKLKF